MKKFVALLSTLLLAFGLCFADPAEGLWKSVDDKTGEVTAIWRIYEDGGKLYGTIAAVVDNPQDVVASACKESYKGFPVEGKVNQMKTVGTPWIYSMVKESEGNWKGGKIVNPGDGKEYGCVITFVKAGAKHKKYTAKEDTLAMAGTVGPIQVFQYWIRATDEDVTAVQEKFPAAN